MGFLLDIVPNHMAADSENPWWMDVLEDGPASAYASFFDIDWHPPRKMLQNKVLLPILRRPYAETLESQQIKLTYEQTGFHILAYDDIKLPVAPLSYLLILQHGFGDLESAMGPDHPAVRELKGLFAAATNLPDRVALPSERAGERRLQREALKERLWNLYQSSPEVRAFVDENVRIFDGRKKSPAVLSCSTVCWPISPTFFPTGSPPMRKSITAGSSPSTILWASGWRIPWCLKPPTPSSCVGSNVGLVTGLRIDHIDGLRDPHAYLRRLQERVSGAAVNGSHPPFFVVVEKIRAKGEESAGRMARSAAPPVTPPSMSLTGSSSIPPAASNWMKSTRLSSARRRSLKTLFTKKRKR